MNELAIFLIAHAKTDILPPLKNLKGTGHLLPTVYERFEFPIDPHTPIKWGPIKFQLFMNRDWWGWIIKVNSTGPNSVSTFLEIQDFGRLLWGVFHIMWQASIIECYGILF